MKSVHKTKRIVFLGLCLSIGLVLSYIESVLPFSLGVPGAKIGLPNIVTVLLLYTAGAPAALLVGILRIVVNGFLFGNLFAILYSAAGLAVSFASMVLLKKMNRFGVIGVSAAGGVMHNVGQLLAAAWLAGSSVFFYLPVLLFAGVIAGIVIGIAGGLLTGRLSGLIRREF